MPRVQGSRHPIRGGVADPGRCEGPRGRFAIYILGLWVLVALAGFTTGDAAEVGMMDMLIVLAVVVTLATAGVVWWMFRPKAGKVVICEKCGARYAVVQPPKYTNGWNYDKIAPASGRELPEGEPASDEGSQAPAPASAPSCRQFQRILKNPLTGNGDLLNY